jgi:PAS domain S-box-containing protein/putative nucleotidyltransferase with HDIG domain
MNRPQRGELKRRGALAIFLLSTAIIIAAAMAAFMHFAANLRADSEQALLAVAHLKKAQIENHLIENISDGVIFTYRPAVWRRLDSAGASPAPQPDLDAAITQTRKAYGYRAIVLLDARGRPVHPAADARFDALVNAAASAAVQSRQSAFVDMHRVAGNALAYGMVHPVFRGGNQQADVIGAVYIEVDPAQQLLPLVAEWPGNSPSAESVLVRRDGNEAVFLATLRHKPEAQPLDERRPITDDRVLAVRALQAPAGAIRGAVDYRGVPVIGVSVRINRTHWMLLSKIDQAEVDQTLHHLAWIIGSLATLFVVLAAAISHLLWRTKRQEQAAAQEGLSRQYTTAIETAIDGYMQLSPDGRIIHANSALARLTGRTVEELQTMTVFELDADMTDEQIRTALQDVTVRDNLRFTTRWRKSVGPPVDIDLSAIHVPDEDNSRSYIHCFTRDITQALALTNRLERITRHYAFQAHVTTRIFQLRDGDDILRAFCDSAISEGNFALAWAGMVDEATGMVRVVAAAGDAADYARSIVVTTDPALATSQGPTGLAIREGRSVIANDFQNDPRTAPWHERGRQYGIQASAVIPITMRGRPVGALNFYSAQAGYFDDEMVALLEATSRTVSLVWEAGKTLQERDSERLNAQRNEARYRRIFINSPVPKQLHRLSDGELVDINEAHRRTFGYALEEIAGSRWVEKAYPDPAIRAPLEARWQADLIKVRQTGVWTESPEVSLRCKDGTARVMRCHMTATDDETIVAWVDLTDIRRGEEHVKDYVARLERSMKGTLQAVARMVDLRDPYTAGHERRVGLIAAAIGREMGWDDDHCRHLEMVGLVHDIGKIAVPAEILSKPTKLNANEFAMIKGHAESGYEILQNVQFDLPVADIIRQHHERLDGSGYPQGLKGDAILPEARVLAVADVLESMSTHRPYRPALGVDAALEELQNNSGILYDGKVVDAVVRLIREKGFVLPD